MLSPVSRLLLCFVSELAPQGFKSEARGEKIPETKTKCKSHRRMAFFPIMPQRKMQLWPPEAPDPATGEHSGSWRMTGRGFLRGAAASSRHQLVPRAHESSLRTHRHNEGSLWRARSPAPAETGSSTATPLLSRLCYCHLPSLHASLHG